jgi:hypothetical protein
LIGVHAPPFDVNVLHVLHILVAVHSYIFLSLQPASFESLLHAWYIMQSSKGMDPYSSMALYVAKWSPPLQLPPI